MYPPPSCVEPAFGIARARSGPGTSSSKGTSRSVSSCTLVSRATSSSLCRVDDQVPMRRIEHQLFDSVRGGRADLVKIGVAQQQLELLANMARVDRAEDHAA